MTIYKKDNTKVKTFKEKTLHAFILGPNIKKFRELQNITQDELAVDLSVTRQTINAWEAKGSVKLDNKKLEELAKLLKVSVEELTDRKSQSVDTNNKGIPFYDTAILREASALEEENPVYTISPKMIDPGTWFKSADGALRVYGHSMFPKYPAGCIIAYKIADKEVIIWGEDYVIELQDRRLLKRIEKSENTDKVKAVSYNKSEEFSYQPVEIPLTKIKNLYMVLGKIELEVSV
jgi:transcriptional regulator with XRE-family HTH domain